MCFEPLKSGKWKDCCIVYKEDGEYSDMQTIGSIGCNHDIWRLFNCAEHLTTPSSTMMTSASVIVAKGIQITHIYNASKDIHYMMHRYTGE